MKLEESGLILDILSKLAAVSPEDSEGHNTVLYMAVNEKTKDYYIGATTNKNSRKSKHKKDLELGKIGDTKVRHHSIKFQNSYNNNPDFEWKELPVEDSETAFYLEKILIENCRKDPHCLNMKGVSTPPMLGKKRSPDLVKKLSDINRGSRRSDETKLQQSKSAKQRWEDPDLLKQQSIRGKEYWKNLSALERNKVINKIKESNIESYKDPILIEQKRKNFKEYWADPINRNRQSETRRNYFANGGTVPWAGIPLSKERSEKLQDGRNRYLALMTEEDKKERYKNISSPVIINGTSYSSMKEASKKEGIPANTIKNRVNSPSFPEYVRDRALF